MYIQGFIILIIFGLTPLLNKHILDEVSAEGVVFFSAIISTFIITIFGCYFFRDKFSIDINTFRKKPHIMCYLIASAIFIFVIADYLYMTTLQNTNKAHLLVSFIAIYPLITVLYSYFFLDHDINIYNIMGAIFVVLGIMLLQR
jgi:hypothetical protein